MRLADVGLAGASSKACLPRPISDTWKYQKLSAEQEPPFGHRHINVIGKYSFVLPDLGPGGIRELRDPDEAGDG